MSRPKMAFQGEPGSNSDEACRTYFPDHEPVACATFEDAFEAVKSGQCALALIPVENSLAGRVPDVHHLLPGSGLKIVGERFKPIHFQLMANPGTKLEDVKTVVSMPIALGQCRKLIRRLKASTAPAGDTASVRLELGSHDLTVPFLTSAALTAPLTMCCFRIHLREGEASSWAAVLFLEARYLSNAALVGANSVMLMLPLDSLSARPAALTAASRVDRSGVAAAASATEA